MSDLASEIAADLVTLPYFDEAELRDIIDGHLRRLRRGLPCNVIFADGTRFAIGSDFHDFISHVLVRDSIAAEAERMVERVKPLIREETLP